MLKVSDIIELIKTSNSWDDFKSKVLDHDKKHVEHGLKIESVDMPDKLSGFNQKLKQGLNYNPKQHEK